MRHADLGSLLPVLVLACLCCALHAVAAEDGRAADTDAPAPHPARTLSSDPRADGDAADGVPARPAGRSLSTARPVSASAPRSDASPSGPAATAGAAASAAVAQPGSTGGIANAPAITPQIVIPIQVAPRLLPKGFSNALPGNLPGVPATGNPSGSSAAYPGGASVPDAPLWSPTGGNARGSSPQP